MSENNAGNHEFKQVAIRLKVKESESLYSPEPVDSALKAVKLLADFMKDMDRECVYIINLNTKMRPLSFNLASVGGISYAPMDPANVFKSAILTNAAHVIVLHVHPSGDTKASQADIEVTKRIALAGTVLGIPLQDHIIVAGESGEFRSMKYDMSELFTDTIRLGQERAELLKAESVTEASQKAYEPAPKAQKNQDPDVYNEVMMLIRRGQEIENSTPDAWRLSHEVAEIWSEHNGEKLNDQDFEVQKFIVMAAEDIAKGNTDTIKT
ncbi:MAG: JAB domain-containing protein, partial [Lachnospiraceae bacterium]|nr:JAB domain-containing protein [Lachnospiraceae bacterium]